MLRIVKQPDKRMKVSDNFPNILFGESIDETTVSNSLQIIRMVDELL